MTEWLFMAGLHVRQLPCCNHLIYSFWLGQSQVWRRDMFHPLCLPMAEPFSPAGGTCEVGEAALVYREACTGVASRQRWCPCRPTLGSGYVHSFTVI